MLIKTSVNAEPEVQKPDNQKRIGAPGYVGLAGLFLLTLLFAIFSRVESEHERVRMRLDQLCKDPYANWVSCLVDGRQRKLTELPVADVGKVTAIRIQAPGMHLISPLVSSMIFTNAEEFNFDNCVLRELPAELGAYKKLVRLSASNCYLENLHALSGCNGLENLDLEENKLTTLQDLDAVGNLRCLDLRGNPLVDIEQLSALARQYPRLANSTSDGPVPCISLTFTTIWATRVAEIDKLFANSSIYVDLDSHDMASDCGCSDEFLMRGPIGP